MSPNPVTSAPATEVLRGAVRLSDWGVIRAQGEDARKFLHGQLTQDVEHLEEGLARLAGYCSVKGRLQATFVMWSRGADEVLLACSADLLPAVLKRLSMFVLRAKCKLCDASAELPVWGLVADGGVDGESFGLAAVLPSPWRCLTDAALQMADGVRTVADMAIRLPDAALPGGRAQGRYLLVGGSVPALPAISLDTWRALEVHSGVGRVVAATVEQFVPQMINLELVGGVNFQKGCYPGQEIVARSQYRGTLKRRAFVVTGAELLQPGRELFHSADLGQPAGRVVLSGQAAGAEPVALVELKLAALGEGSLHAAEAAAEGSTADAVLGAALTVLELPYAIPTEAP